jgi:hypothetical protein
VSDSNSCRRMGSPLGIQWTPILTRQDRNRLPAKYLEFMSGPRRGGEEERGQGCGARALDVGRDQAAGGRIEVIVRERPETPEGFDQKARAKRAPLAKPRRPYFAPRSAREQNRDGGI